MRLRRATTTDLGTIQSVLLRRIKSLVRRYVSPAFVVRGKEKQSGLDLAVLFVGSVRQNEYLVKKIFDQQVNDRKSVNRCSFSSAPSVMRRLKCDLAIVAGERSSLSNHSSEISLQIPWWVDCEIDCASALDGGGTKALRKDIRKIAKYGLYADTPNSPDDILFFYERIYAPTILQSHGAAALPSSLQKRARQIESGAAELLLVKQNDKTIGGTVIDYRQKMPALRDIGVLDGDNSYKKQGVITAANFFAVQRLAQQGHHTFSMGLSRCFVDDGVFAYKTKWHPRFTDASSGSYLILLNELSDVSRALLVSFDCIAATNGTLERFRFTSVDEEQRLDQYRPVATTTFDGVQGTVWFDVAGKRIRKMDSSPDEIEHQSG